VLNGTDAIRIAADKIFPPIAHLPIHSPTWSNSTANRSLRAEDDIMSVADAVEWVKLVGGLGGLASSGFLIYDRIWRLRPIVYLQPQKGSVYLCVRNVANETLVIDRIDVSPKVFVISMRGNKDDFRSRLDASVDAMFETETDGESRTFSVLDPQEERSFQLNALKECDALKSDDTIRIRCVWRTTRRPWPIRRTVSQDNPERLHIFPRGLEEYPRTLVILATSH
jgi:hypothetical protein